MFWKIWKNNDGRFDEIFKNHIANTVAAAKELEVLFSHDTVASEKIDAIIAREHAGDDLTKEVHHLLADTFITTIDKEDIVTLINELDHIIDFMKKAAVRLEIYDIGNRKDDTMKFAYVIMAMTQELQTLVNAMPGKMQEVSAGVIRIKELEEKADALLHETLKKLSHDEKVDAKILVEWKDIFESLEQVTDHCEDAANVLSSIARKAAR